MKHLKAKIVKMDKLNLNKVYVLNPFYHLRHDVHRVILFSRGGTDNLCSRNWCTFIHPLQAALLSFFTYERPLKETIGLLCDFFCRAEEDIVKWVTEYINNPYPIHNNSKYGKIYFPKRVLIKVEEAGDEFKYLQLNANLFLWKKLDLTTRRLYTGPLIVTLMLNNQCVTRCKYCYADTSTIVRNPLSTERLLELIRESSNLNVERVNLMGGEVFLHKEWHILLKELVLLNIAPEFLSTKMPPNEEVISKLKECGYKGILQISLDACDDEVLHKSIGTKYGYAKQMLNGIHLLDKHGIKYQIATVLTNYNCHIDILKEMYLKLSTLKEIHDWRIVPVNNSITKEYKEFSRLKPTKWQMFDVFNQMQELIDVHKGFPIILGRDAILKRYRQTDGGSCNFAGSECSALTTHLFVLPDGKVTICEQLYWNPLFIIGDARLATLKEIWESPKALELYTLGQEKINPHSQCSHCKLFEKCFSYHNRCWSDIIKAYGNDCWDYPDPRCKFAPEMKNNLGYD